MTDTIGGMFGIPTVVLVAYCGCRIASKLGYSSYAGLLLMIPVVNLITWVVWAFSDSPSERASRDLKARLSRAKAPGVATALNTMHG